MSDIVVTVNPSQSGPTISIGGGVYPHAATHAPNGSDSLSGYYYPSSNPSGYVSSGDFATTGYVADVSGAIVSQISFPPNVVFTTGVQSISGVKNFISRLTVNGTGVLLSGEASAVSTGYLTGYVSKLETGLFYPINNPSGYITGVNLSAYQTIVGSTGISGYLQTQISAINLSPLQTATGVLNTRVTSLESHTGEYYLITNPSGYITGVDLSPYSTISYVTGVSGYLNGKISTLQTATGDLNNRSISALFISGTSTKTVTLLRGDGSTISTTFTDISGDFSAPSGYLQNQITNLNNQTGSYVTGLVVRPSQTGAFLTSETDPIFAASVAYNISSLLTGNWTDSYDKSVTGINVAGSTTKTITLYRRDGGNISASFTDSEGTGAGADFYIYSGSFDSGNGNLILNRTGDNGTVVIPLDGRYSTVPATTGISGYLQGQISAINLTPLQSATGNLNVRVTSLESQTGNYTTGSVIRPSDTGAFYANSNPSGYITGVNLSSYATIDSLTGVSGYLQTQISTLEGQTGSYVTGNIVRPSDTGLFIINSQTGVFYPISNPSGYITGVDLSSLQTATGNLDTRVSFIEGQTGNFVLKSATGALLTTGAADLRFYPLSSNPSSYLTASDISSLASTGYVTGVSGYLQNSINSLNSATGLLYPRNNPSGYITGVDLSSYATVSIVTGASGDLQDQISTLNSQTGSYVTGSIVRPSDTGAFYAASNPSGYVTGIDLSSYQTTAASTGISGFLDGQISTLETATGDLNNRSIKTMFVSGTNTKTITLVRGDDSTISTTFTDISGDFSAPSGYLQGQVDTLNNLTGSTIYSSDTGVFYPISNPSGYITGVDLSNYPTIGYVTGVSGYLSGEISSLQSATGSYLTGENDPVFAASVAFNIDSSLTGNWGTSYNESVTGVNVAGSTTKTITLYQRNGGTLTADFTDSQGTGAGADFYIYSGSFDSGNGNLTLNRTGDGGSVVISLDGRYSTVPFVTGISGYLQDQIGAINLSALETATGNLDGRVSSIESQTGNYVTGSVIRPEDTGIFYTNDNPSGYITGIDLSSYQTVTVSTGISGFLQNQISSLNGATGNLNTRVSAIETQTGNFALKNDTGAFLTTGAADLRFYPLSSNPSSYLVTADIASLASTGYVTGVSGYLQGEINTLNSTTGLLYPRNNPSGYITGVDLSSYALQSSINSINAQSGQWITGYNKSITGLSFAGTDTKTLTLYGQDGSSLSANFTDLQGTGASISDIVYLTGDQNISGVKDFSSRPTVNGTGVLLIGEASSGGSISIEDSNLIIGLSIFL